MRRFVVLMAAIAATLPVAVSQADPPLIPRACTPAGPLDVERPAACKRVTYKHGPLHVTPGDNLILFGPVTVDKPLEPGMIVRFRADLEYLDGTIPPIEIVHLHHAVWISTSTGTGAPLFASGEEKTIISIPNGYGIRHNPYDQWVLNYMLHNQTPVPQNVLITYEIDLIPSAAAAGIVPVVPYWLDVGAFNGFNPVYNTQMGKGSGGECAFPREDCANFDPYGKKVAGNNGASGNGVGLTRRPPAGTIVFMLGHLHPGGLRLEVDLKRAGQPARRVFRSDAVYFDPGGPISWDMAMEVTRPEFRLRIQPGDELIVNSVYETARASWYEGMGIVVTYIATGVSEPDVGGPDTVGITHGPLEEAQNHGGPDGPPLRPGRAIETDRVAIAGFQYLPGSVGDTYPVVRRGQPLRFENLEAAGIYHTVTACKAPCNGPTGISYPLANGPIDFDSLELGYGPPSATAAANTHSFTLFTNAFEPGIYTYYCRVHPFMRGMFAVS